MDESWRMSGRRGRGNARLLVAYIVKKGEPRRIEASQPACGAALGIP